jgi:hypothetical protein
LGETSWIRVFVGRGADNRGAHLRLADGTLDGAAAGSQNGARHYCERTPYSIWSMIKEAFGSAR